MKCIFNKISKNIICIFSVFFFLMSNCTVSAATIETINSTNSSTNYDNEENCTIKEKDIDSNTTLKSTIDEKENNPNNKDSRDINKDEYISEDLIKSDTNQNPSNEEVIVNSYEEDNTLINYYGKWSKDTNSANSAETSVYSDSTNAYFTFAFTGTGFTLYGYRSNSKGFVNIYVDGQKVTQDTYSVNPQRQCQIYQVNNLANTKHVIKVEVAHEKNENSYGYYVNIDKIDITDGVLVPTNNTTTYEEDNSFIDYTGKWLCDNNSENSNGSSKFSDATNACITFSFNGTGFAWYGFANNSKGIANIYVDDKKIEQDTYLNKLEYQHLFFKLENLENTNHIIRIEVSGKKSSSSFGPYINFDKLDIYDGELTPICPAISTYQEDNLLLLYNGNWTKDINDLNSNGSSRYSGNPGDSVTFAFNGTGFKWYGYSNNSKGIANIYIDGNKIEQDTYSFNGEYQHPIYEINSLTSGKHIIKIEVSNQKNINSYGKYINIDKIDIFNGIMTSVSPTNYYEEDDSLIDYTGKWSTDNNLLNSSSTSKFSDSANSSVTFSFNGSGFRWYGYGNNSKGIANIYIDGKEFVKDTYQDYQQYQCPFYEVLFDNPGKHKVTIKVSGLYNKSSYGPYINIDKIDIFNGTLIPNDNINTYDEDNPLIKFNGNWLKDNISKYSDSKDDSIDFSFKGTGFVWYGYANNSKGIADIYIDGLKVSELDTYSDTQEYQRPFYKIDTLQNIEHTVKIVVSGEKNPNSYGYYINLDKIDIYDGTLIDIN